jgi:glycosyltransferase involved in cell wall biosynthesis
MPGRLLFVLPSVLSKTKWGLEIDYDMAEGIRLYLKNFDEVRVASPVTTDFQDSGLRRTVRVDDLPYQKRLKFFPLPNGYKPADFLYFRSKVRSILKAEIEKADFLIFSPHTLIGDWPTIGIQEAVKLKRSYVIEADVVYESVAMSGRRPGWKQQVQSRIINPLFQRVHRFCLRNSNLALFQGQDVFDAYAPFCRNPHKVYHLSISREDLIPETELQAKLASVGNRPLKVCYAGRAIDMKGPFDWLNALSEAIHSGERIEASWLGDGSLLNDMRDKAIELGIADHVKFAGYIGGREAVLKTLRDSDVLLFTHKTRESARIFAEALVSACPIVGYGTSYPEELVHEHGGGLFAPVGDWKALANYLTTLASDPEALRDLITRSGQSGRLYDRDTAMQRRIDLIKQHMGWKEIEERSRMSVTPPVDTQRPARSFN